uniref:FP protein C-terminal domain-containing protein n=1 Tax=Cacopsylla melanoneura TaxID=428564 RepID=A0A8D8Q5I4_9HEMI
MTTGTTVTNEEGIVQVRITSERNKLMEIKKRKLSNERNRFMDMQYFSEYNAHQQRIRLQNIVVNGHSVPLVPKHESIRKLVEQIGHMLGFKQPLRDVEKAWRQNLGDDKRGCVVIRLINRGTRAKWVYAYSKKRLWAKGALYVNEHLTKPNQVLFLETKRLGRMHKWRFIWLHDGIIRVRKDENSEIFEVRNPNELYSVLNISKSQTL